MNTPPTNQCKDARPPTRQLSSQQLCLFLQACCQRDGIHKVCVSSRVPLVIFMIRMSKLKVGKASWRMAEYEYGDLQRQHLCFCRWCYSFSVINLLTFSALVEFVKRVGTFKCAAIMFLKTYDLLILSTSAAPNQRVWISQVWERA